MYVAGNVDTLCEVCSARCTDDAVKCIVCCGRVHKNCSVRDFRDPTLSNPDVDRTICRKCVCLDCKRPKVVKPHLCLCEVCKNQLSNSISDVQVTMTCKHCLTLCHFECGSLDDNLDFLCCKCQQLKCTHYFYFLLWEGSWHTIFWLHVYLGVCHSFLSRHWGRWGRASNPCNPSWK